MKNLLLIVTLFGAGVLNAQIDHWENVIDQGLNWKYFVGNAEPPADWMDKSFSDTGWQSGQSGFGYGDGDDATAIPTYTPAVYIRGYFNIVDSASIPSCVLHIDYDDGFVAYLNGIEIARSANMGTPGVPVAYNQYATPDHEAEMYQGNLPEMFMISPNIVAQALRTGNNVLAIQVNNYSAGSSDMSLIPFFSVGTTDTAHHYNALPSWFWVDTTFLSSNLPLVFINTFGVPVNDEERILAQIGIIDNGPGNRNYVTDPFNNFSGKAGIKIRGSSSAYYFPQKSYGLELWDDDSLDIDAPILGMPAESDWILYGPYSDKSLLRNNIIYDIGNKMGHWTTGTRFCEVFLNNQYIGIYVMMEKIKRGNNRVDIARLKTTDTSGVELTGGYILKVDRYDDDEATWVSPYRNIRMVIHYPKLDSLQQQQYNYIKNKITAFEDVINSSYYNDPMIGYRNWVNMSSLIDYVICTEVTNNIDAFSLSTFFYKDRDDVDSTIHFGPIWDYNLGFGNANYGQGWYTDNWRYYYKEQGGGIPKWWIRFWSDPYFLSALKARWTEVRQSFLHTDSVLTYIDDQVLVLNEAQVRHFAKWPILGTYTWPNYYIGDTFEEEILWLKNWIIQRLDWLDANLPQYYVMPAQNTLYLNATQNSTAYLLINANTSWQVLSASTWITLTNNTGTGNSDVTVKVNANPFTTQRTGVLILTSSSIPGLTIYIKVIQFPGTTGVEENAFTDIEIFPNPTSGPVTLLNFPERASVNVFDAAGNCLLYKAPVQNALDISVYPDGVYTFCISNDEACLWRKIVKISKQ